MNEVLNEILLKKQLPAYVYDTLGNASFGPSLKTQSNDVVIIENKTFSIDALMQRCADDVEIKKLTAELVYSISKASPRKLYRYQNAGLWGKLWNGLTGGIDSKIIEFDLYCRKVDTLAKYAPLALEQVQESVHLIKGLHNLYQRDVSLLEQYIDAGTTYIEELDSSVDKPSKTLEFGLSRLRRKLVNMKVTKSTLEMHAVSVEMSLNASLQSLERLSDCINGLMPMWQQQVRMFRSGVYDINIDKETDENFRVLVKKINSTSNLG